MASVLLVSCILAGCVALGIVILLYRPSRRPGPYRMLPRASLSTIEPYRPAPVRPAGAHTVVVATQ